MVWVQNMMDVGLGKYGNYHFGWFIVTDDLTFW